MSESGEVKVWLPAVHSCEYIRERNKVLRLNSVDYNADLGASSGHEEPI